MTLNDHNIKKLKEIKNLIVRLAPSLYTTPKEIISGATVGQHFRHILEFYFCLEKGIKSGTVCYDSRERNLSLESDLIYAIKSIEKAIDFIADIKEDKSLLLNASYSKIHNEQVIIQTSLYRELAYALDHTVHHLAIVKIALSEEKDQVELDKNFGVAPSTIRYREQCVQ